MIWAITLKGILVFETIRAQSSLSIFAQKYAKILILSYKISYLTFMEDSFGARILRDDCTFSKTGLASNCTFLEISQHNVDHLASF